MSACLHCGAHLINAGQIAELVGLGPSAVSNWIARYDDFPEPLATGHVYDLVSVLDWLVDTGRMRGVLERLVAEGRLEVVS